MDLDFERALDDISVVIQDFYLRNFNRKDNVPPKAQHVLPSVLLVKVLRKWMQIWHEYNTDSSFCLFGCNTCSRFSPCHPY